jgi:hypothetical protein
MPPIMWNASRFYTDYFETFHHSIFIRGQISDFIPVDIGEAQVMRFGEVAEITLSFVHPRLQLHRSFEWFHKVGALLVKVKGLELRRSQDPLGSPHAPIRGWTHSAGTRRA